LSSTEELVDEPAGPSRAAEGAGAVAGLTARQREVLALIGHGLSTAEIAQRLFRTVKTIESHRLMLGKRLGARNRVELARIAIQAGLIEVKRDGHATPAEVLEETPDAMCPATADALVVMMAGISGQTGDGFLRALVEQLVASLDASAALIFRAGADGAGELVIGWSERGVMRPIAYPLPVAEDALMGPGNVRIIDGPPSTMLAQVADISVLQAGSSILAALHDSNGQRQGTLAVLLKGGPEASRACADVLRLLAGRVAAELERKESEDRFLHLRSLLASAADRIGLWERNLRTDHVTWSSETYRILGFEPYSIPASCDRFLSMVHPDDRRRVRDACDGAVRGVPPESIEYRVIRCDGDERRVLACFEAAPDITGRPEWVLGTIRDITPD
jgi:PAS domain S-box-containing protein